MSLAAARSSIERVLEGCIAAGAPGAIIAIEAPPPGASFSAASGLFARGESRRLRPEDPFRAATVSKAVTAATAVCLAARNYWALDDPVTPFLPPAIRDLLGGLEDLPAIDTSTIRRLLNHTSGLPEYFFDEAFQRRAKAELGRLWCPVELVEAAVATGRLAFPPATDFSYGDTGYVVAGIAIEQVLNSPLGDACRSLVFDPVGMNATCLEWDEPPRGGAVSHHYDGERNLLPLNTSFDRGWPGHHCCRSRAVPSWSIRGVSVRQALARRADDLARRTALAAGQLRTVSPLWTRGRPEQCRWRRDHWCDRSVGRLRILLAGR